MRAMTIPMIMSLLAVLWLAAGCALPKQCNTSAKSPAPAATKAVKAVESAPARPVMGLPVSELLRTAGPREVQIFDSEGNIVEAVPAAADGSVSIFSLARDSQDNYTFDAQGVITRHQRSSGTNYLQGIWQDVK